MSFCLWGGMCSEKVSEPICQKRYLPDLGEEERFTGGKVIYSIAEKDLRSWHKPVGGVR